MLSHDNVALEFAIPVCNSSHEVEHEIHKALQRSKEASGGLDFLDAPSAIFPNDLLKSEEAQRFGCDPDYDVYDIKENIATPPNDGMRTIGMHLHFGHPFLVNAPYNVIRFTKWLDATVGIVGVLADPSEAAKRRRRLYGRAGCMRIKEYGDEYRTPSPWPLRSRASVVSVFDIAQFALDLCMEECEAWSLPEREENPNCPVLDEMQKSLGINVRDTINNMDFANAARWAFEMDKTGIGLLDLAQESVSNRSSIEQTWL